MTTMNEKINLIVNMRSWVRKRGNFSRKLRHFLEQLPRLKSTFTEF